MGHHRIVNNKMKIVAVFLLATAVVWSGDPITVDPDKGDKAPIDLSGTDLTTKYCTLEGKRCDKKEISSGYLSSISTCLGKCSRDTNCLTVFMSIHTCQLISGRCESSDLVAAMGTDYYRLKKGESCPDDRKKFVAPKGEYSNSFCMIADKACPGNGMYPNPQNIQPWDACLKRCVNSKACAGVDMYPGEKKFCDPKTVQCSEDELVYSPGTYSYNRLPIGVDKCAPPYEEAYEPGPPLPTPAPVECRKTNLGHDYLGHRAVTSSGKTCQRWDSQSPHKHPVNNVNHFPKAALNEANYCRNPDDAPGGPWCYTTDRKIRWEYCDIPMYACVFSNVYSDTAPKSGKGDDNESKISCLIGDILSCQCKESGDCDGSYVSSDGKTCIARNRSYYDGVHAVVKCGLGGTAARAQDPPGDWPMTKDNWKENPAIQCPEGYKVKSCSWWTAWRHEHGYENARVQQEGNGCKTYDCKACRVQAICTKC